nr:ATP synthase F0 subunit 8 [Rhizophagus clarus]
MFMPQLVPFYFINQLSFGLILLSLLIYLASKRLLPQLLQRFISRIFITLS